MRHYFDKAPFVLLVLTLAYVAFDSGFEPLHSAIAAMLGGAALVVLAWTAHADRHSRVELGSVHAAQTELFRATLANIGDAVVACDHDGRVVFMNDAAETVTRWRAGNALGVPVSDVVRIVDERTHKSVESSAQQALRRGVPIPSSHRGRLVARGSSFERPIEDSACPVRDGEGRITGVVLVFRDITERKRSEDAMLEADRRKDEFLAVLAHELRNPLAPLRNALHILRMGGGDPAIVEQVTGMMDRQVRQMVRLIDDLLDVSRITRGKLELRRERLAVQQVIEEALEMSAPAVARGGQRVEVVVAPGCPHVDGDRARLVQVLDNLLVNAAKYGSAGGLISVRAEPGAGGLCIRVKDNGIGIPRDMLEKIFEMFTQVDRTLEAARGGLGIGLTLVRRIVELHGGTVTARSAGPGQGSEFVVTLPAEGRIDISPNVPVAAAFAQRAARPLRIVVTDDNEDSMQSMAGALRALGHDVRTALDGEACIAVCAEFAPQALLLDIGMPRLNGYDTASRIRGERWGRGMLVIAMTGWGQEHDRRRARDAGFDHHLVKPVDFEALLAILASVPHAQPLRAEQA